MLQVICLAPISKRSGFKQGAIIRAHCCAWFYKLQYARAVQFT